MSRSILLALLAALPGVSSANDFPTQARVEFVLECMGQHGGQSYDTLYGCVCVVDRIADEMPYAEFAEADVFLRLRSTPGERGGLFRDPEQAETLTAKLEAALERAERRCFVRRVENDTLGND
jgi:hypothetical protein